MLCRLNLAGGRGKSAPAMPMPCAPDELTADPDLHLLVDGRRCEPEWRGSVAVFRLRLPVRALCLASRAGRQSDMGVADDARLLGYWLTRLSVTNGAESRDIALDDDALGGGFHACEPAGRWTDGRAELLPAAFSGLRGTVALVVAGTGLAAYPVVDAQAADRALVAGFESLGDNCEFGFVQRHFGAEPRSLLRWASTDAARLSRGLRRRFAGIGAPAHTAFTWSETALEYTLRDAHTLASHTFRTARFASAEEEAAAVLAGGARLRLLARKLLADIAAARRIFVFKTDDPGPHEARFHELHAALRGVGPAALLCVWPAAAPDEVGQVVARGDGLFVGRVDRFVGAEGPFDVWRRLCLTTRDLVAREQLGRDAAA